MRDPSPIALTGATGFIGSHIARACPLRGIRTRCLVREPSAKSEAIDELGGRIVVGDLDHRDALAVLCEGAQTVVHCAARMGKDDLAASRHVNVEGTRHVLEAALAGGVELFCYVSSISVYRATPSSTRVYTEAVEPVADPKLNAYSLTKLEGEQAVKTFCEQHGLSYLIVRPTNVRGPGCRSWNEEVESVVKRFKISFGDVPLDFVHIDDLVEGILAAVASRAAVNETFNLSGEMVPLRTFYEAIADELGVEVRPVPKLLDAAIRKGMDFFGGLKGEIRSTVYTEHAHYPHDKAAQSFGYSPSRKVRP